jgi:hypothetical protein
MKDMLCRMLKIMPQEWNFESFDNFSDWADELGDVHTSSVLAKQWSILIRFSHNINKLSKPLLLE